MTAVHYVKKNKGDIIMRKVKNCMSTIKVFKRKKKEIPSKSDFEKSGTCGMCDFKRICVEVPTE